MPPEPLPRGYWLLLGAGVASGLIGGALLLVNGASFVSVLLSSFYPVVAAGFIFRIGARARARSVP